MEEKKAGVSIKETLNVKKINPLTLVLVGIFLIFVVFIGGLYLFTVSGVNKLSRSGFILKSASVFNVPVAKVAKNKISYTEYVKNMEAMEKFYETDESGATQPTPQEMSDFVLSRLLVNSIIEDLAKEYELKITEEEINKIVDEQIMPNFASKEDAEAEILNRYNWTLDEFVKQIVIPTELENRVAEYYMSSVFTGSDSSEEIKNLALEVLGRIKNGEDFATLAQEYGADATAETGGDLGWFSKGMMVEPFENAVFALEKGQLKEDLVETEFGYHIVKVDDKRTITDEITGEEVEEIRASHILFPFGQNGLEAYQQFMTDRIKNTKIDIIDSIHNPLEEFIS